MLLSNPPSETQSGAAVQAPASAPAEERAPTIETVAAERDRALAEKEELWDRFLRKQVELENFRNPLVRFTLAPAAWHVSLQDLALT